MQYLGIDGKICDYSTNKITKIAELSICRNTVFSRLFLSKGIKICDELNILKCVNRVVDRSIVKVLKSVRNWQLVMTYKNVKYFSTVASSLDKMFLRHGRKSKPI